MGECSCLNCSSSEFQDGGTYSNSKPGVDLDVLERRYLDQPWSCIISCKQGLPYVWTMQTNYNLESLACQFTDNIVSPTTFNGSAAFAFWSCPLCCSPNCSPLLSYHSTDVTNSFEVLSDSNITSNSSCAFYVCAFYNPEEGDATSLENQRIGGKASPHET